MTGRAGEVIDAGAIQALIAHRYPFLLVDAITIEVPGELVVGHKQVTGAEWASGAPAQGAGGVQLGVARGVSGLVVIEALAQTSAALMRDLVATQPGAVGYFVGMERVRLRHPPVAGDTLRLEVRLASFRRGIARLAGRATVDGRLAASARFTTILRPAVRPVA
jgi:3-hydroxyacyl-[acyl-carrier-protein] dehydratase